MVYVQVYNRHSSPLSTMKSKNPFIIQKRNPLWALARPSSLGILSGTVFAFSSKYFNFPVEIRASLLERIPFISSLSDRVYLAVIGFLFGFGAAKGCNALRLWLLKVLLGYHGWMHNPKSFKTKVRTFYISNFFLISTYKEELKI